jgi:hypothetical protein
MDNNTVRFACDLRLEELAVVSIQFRATPSGKGILGPTIRLAEGKVSGSGGPLGTYRAGEWLHLEMDLRLGEGSYSISVAPREAEDPEKETFAFRDPAFQRCTWVGVISTGTAQASYYLDNLELKPVSP